MADPAHRLRRSFAEYLEIERASEVKHQLVDGEIFAMTGGTFGHSRIAANLLVGLTNRLHGGSCTTVGPDARLWLEAADIATYPDVSVICGERRSPSEDPESTTNPTLVAEVLSPSTERFDRGRKRDAYFTLPSLRHYLLVRADRARIELYTRQDEATWTFRAWGPAEAMPLPALGIELSVSEVYEGVDLDDAAVSIPPEEA